MRSLGLEGHTRGWDAKHKVAGLHSVMTDRCADVLLRFEDNVVAVTLGMMELPVELLLGMDVLGRLGAVLDLPQGTLILAEIGVTIDLERNSSS
jgi:hypothetical protein